MSKELKIGERIESIMRNAQDEIELLAKIYREEVLIPFCSKHRLEYDCGNADVYFTGEDDISFTSAATMVAEGHDLTDEEKAQVSKIFIDLDEQTIGNSIFGGAIEPIRKKDWVRLSPSSSSRKKVKAARA